MSSCGVSRVEDEHRSGGSDRDIDELHGLEIHGNLERSQGPAGDELQPVQRSRAVGRRGARHPQVSALRIDFDRRDVKKPGGVGAHRGLLLIRALVHRDQLASKPIAQHESA